MSVIKVMIPMMLSMCLVMSLVSCGGGDTAVESQNNDSDNPSSIPKKNSPPVAQDDQFTIDEDHPPKVLDLLTGDTDPDNDVLTIKAINGVSLMQSEQTITLDNSIINVSQQREVILTVEQDFHGTILFNYTVQDQQGGEDIGQVVVVVNSINDDPNAVDDAYITVQNTAIDIVAGINSDYDLEFDPTLAADHQTYYVDHSADHHGDGSQEHPFNTIQQGLDQAQPGDLVYIRAGIYRETVNSKRSGTQQQPIRLAAYPQEKVIISGTDPLSGDWQEEGPNVFSLRLSNQTWFNLGTGKNQVFADGQMLVEARWPNVPEDVNPATVKNQYLAIADDGEWLSTVTDATPNGETVELRFIDQDLKPLTGLALADANITFQSGHKWHTKTGNVMSTNGTSLDFNYLFDAQNHVHRVKPKKGNSYFIWGSKALLDAPNEWYYDPQQQTLYLYLADDRKPQDLAIEVKRRSHGFQVFSQNSYIELYGVDFFATTAILNSDSTGNIIADTQFSYAAHNLDLREYIATSLLLWSDDSIVAHAVFQYNSAPAIDIRGQNNQLLNSTIVDSNYLGGLSAVETSGVGHKVMYNTVSKTGGVGIAASADAAQFSHNHVHDIGYITTDIAGINVYGNVGMGTHISYNRVHDIVADYDVAAQYYGGVGIRIDAGGQEAADYVIHHNIIWNTTSAGIHTWGLEPSMQHYENLNNLIYHNTVIGTIGLINGGNSFKGTQLINNLVTGDVSVGEYADAYGPSLITNATDVGLHEFIAPQHHDYGLVAHSTHIDAGTVIANINDDYLADAPDLGALESGRPLWFAGDTTGSLLSNDSDPEQDPIFIMNVTTPANGSVVLNTDGSITYTPKLNFVGDDAFQYTLADSNRGTDSATVNLTVKAL